MAVINVHSTLQRDWRLAVLSHIPSRKSPKMSNIMKSMSYKRQTREFRVFRQSLRIPKLLPNYRYRYWWVSSRINLNVAYFKIISV